MVFVDFIKGGVILCNVCGVMLWWVGKLLKILFIIRLILFSKLFYNVRIFVVIELWEML